MAKYDNLILIFIICVLILFILTANISAAEDSKNTKIKITIGDKVATAFLEDNSTTRALVDKLPLTLPMMDLYARELVYRFENPLPADKVQNRSYEVGEIIYWPPRHSFVIMYAQNGEEFSMQKVGDIESNIEIFENAGDTDVKFELLDPGSEENNISDQSNKNLNREGTAVILEMNGREVIAELNNTLTAQEFKKLLPYSVTVSRAADDLCGSVSEELPSNDSEGQTSWEIGEIGWFGGWFTILVDNEDNFSDMPGIMIIGKVAEEDIDTVASFTGRVDITVRLAD